MFETPQLHARGQSGVVDHYVGVTARSYDYCVGGYLPDDQGVPVCQATVTATPNSIDGLKFVEDVRMPSRCAVPDPYGTYHNGPCFYRLQPGFTHGAEAFWSWSIGPICTAFDLDGTCYNDARWAYQEAWYMQDGGKCMRFHIWNFESTSSYASDTNGCHLRNIRRG